MGALLRACTLTAGLLLCANACSSILGLDKNYSVDAAQAAVAGSAGVAGADSSVTDGSGGIAGSGGAGTGGLAGSGGGGGAGGTLPQCDAGQPLTVTSNYTPDTTLDAPYDYSYAATGGCPPYRWTVINGQLPPGLQMSLAGRITGSATTLGTYYFTCCDSVGSCTTNDRGIAVRPANG